jgi:tripartite-type tricarboxylate transporter receptor subunit TctC
MRGRITRRRALPGLAAVLAMPGAAGRAQEAAWPARPITLVVASAAGGALDATGRALQPKLAALLGQSVVVDNRGGGGGVLGVEAAARAPADGHTLLLGHLGVLVVNPLIRPEAGMDALALFAPVSLAVEVPSVLVVPAQRPWRSLREVIAAAKARPGALSWGHSGVGSTNHLSGALLDRAAGIETVGVPYRGGGPLALDLLAGRLDYSFVTSASVWPHLEAGRLRALAVPSAARGRFLPEVPTVEEAVGLPGFEVLNWYGLLAPRGTPAAVVARLNAAMRAALSDPETAAALERQGLEPRASGPEEFAALILAERETWGPIVRAAGVSAE